jgi:hypothetical protein
MRKKESAILQRLIFLVFILVLHICFLLPVHAMPPEEVVSAAKKGLGSFLLAIQPQDLKRMGFLNQSEVDNAKVGDGFQTYTIHPTNVLSYREDVVDLSSSVIPTKEWQFLIVANGQAKSILTVDLMGNQWKAVGIGAAGLARQLGIIVQSYPSDAGYSHRFIRVFQARSDFVEISHGGSTIGMIPLISARVAMGLKQRDLEVSDLFDCRDVLLRIAPIVRKNLEAEK